MKDAPLAGAWMALIEGLDGLPNSPGMIAQLLDDLDITGSPGSACWCPMARYLRGISGCASSDELRVKAGTVFLRRGNLILETELPLHVSEFVVRFDFGDYPGLNAANWLMAA